MGEAELDRRIERATITDRQQLLQVLISEHLQSHRPSHSIGVR
jgi:hypothetical protein